MQPRHSTGLARIVSRAVSNYGICQPVRPAFARAASTRVRRDAKPKQNRPQVSQGKTSPVRHSASTNPVEELPNITLDSIPIAVLRRYFQEAVATKTLDETLLLAIATSLHHAKRPNDERDSLLRLASAVVLHVKQHSATIPPSPTVYHHLLMTLHRLGAYQEGWDFFRWLSRQDVDFTSPEVYGAGIELAAAQNASSDSIRATIAELLDTALDRFPDGFAKYHFQPNARLADRSVVTKQGQDNLLLLARATRCLLRHGLIRDGYLGLDTLLRLCPTSTPLIVVSETVSQRNVFEAYKVLMLRYRNHTGSRYTSPVPLISKINSLLRTDSRSNELPADLRVELISACVTLVRACLVSGGSFDSAMCTSVVKSLSYAEGPELEQRIFPVAKRLVYRFLEQQLPSQRSVTPVNALLGISARMDDKTHFAEICSGLEDAGVVPDASTYMTMMGHATTQGNLAAFQLAWEGLRDVDSSGTPASQRHWAWFASKGASFGDEGRQWVAAQVRQHAAFIPDPVAIQRIVNEAAPVSTVDGAAPTATTRESATEVVDRLVDNLDRLLSEMEGTTRHSFAHHDFPMSISPRHEPAIASDEVLRIVYDRLTASPETAPSKSAGPTLHQSGYITEDLRYENWKSLTELLRFASTFQRCASQTDDEASLRPIMDTLHEVESSPRSGQIEDVQARIERWRGITKEAGEE